MWDLFSVLILEHMQFNCYNHNLDGAICLQQEEFHKSGLFSELGSECWVQYQVWSISISWLPFLILPLRQSYYFSWLAFTFPSIFTLLQFLHNTLFLELACSLEGSQPARRFFRNCFRYILVFRKHLWFLVDTGFWCLTLL